MSTDTTQEPAGEPTGERTSAAAQAPVIPESPGAAPAKPAMARSTRILAFTAAGVVAAAALFGGGVAFGTSLNTGASSAQQGQFGGTPPTGTGPGGTTGTAPTGAPTDAAGGTTTTG